MGVSSPLYPSSTLLLKLWLGLNPASDELAVAVNDVSVEVGGEVSRRD